MSVLLLQPTPMTLGEFNLAAAGAATVLLPLSVQLDLALTGPFGIGALQADLQTQFNTAISATAALSISLTNPLASYQLALTSLVQVQATIAAALAAGVPTIGVEIGGQLSASAALSASLGVKLAGISAAIQAGLQVKVQALQVLGELEAHLSAGEIAVLGIGFDGPTTAAAAGSGLQGFLNGGIPGILASDQVYGVAIITKDPAASAAIQAMFKVS